MAKKPVHRYQLVFHSDKNDDTKVIDLVPGDGSDRDVFTLTEIDAFTSQFSGARELAKAVYLGDLKYEDGHFSVDYKVNHSVNSIDVVYSNLTFLAELARKRAGKSEITKKDIYGYVDRLIVEIENDVNFYAFMCLKSKERSLNRYTNSHFRSVFGCYSTLKNSDEPDARGALWEAKNDLARALLNYKTIRGIEIARDHYSLVKQGLSCPRDPSFVSPLKRARLEYELRHPKKPEKPKKYKKGDPIEGQMPLFDPDEYIENEKTKHMK